MHCSISTLPGNIAEIIFQKVLSVLASHCSECLQVIQNDPFKGILSSGNVKKPDRSKTGEYRGCSKTDTCFLARNHFT
jgi:hypothetical protein